MEPHRRQCFVSLSKNINPSLVLVQPRKTCFFITERLLMGRKESNQTNKTIRVETVWIKNGPDKKSGRIWVQTVHKATSRERIKYFELMKCVTGSGLDYHTN